MSLPSLITKKIRKSLLFNSSVHIDELNHDFVKGWAISKNTGDNPLVLEVYSSKERACIVANQFRADIRKTGQHETGVCGFKFDISAWSDKKVSVRILGGYEGDRLLGFDPSFFIHIPKTAGTSFKRAAEKFFGADGVARNYGAKSPETTPWVKSVVLNDNNFPMLYDNLIKNGIGLYTGHVSALPAANVFKIQKIITFVRNPQEQVISHFNHYSRWYEYTKDVEEFIVNPGFKNLQSRHLKGLPIQLIGFIGITEQYSESIDLFNAYSNWNLEMREDNTNLKKSITSVERPAEDLIASENANDFRLYRSAKKLLAERLALNAQGKEWCYSFIDRLDERCVAGVAYMSEMEGDVSLLIFMKGKLLGRCKSNELRPGLLRFGVPNKGFVGFSFNLPSDTVLSEVFVQVESTGQIIQRKIIL